MGGDHNRPLDLLSGRKKEEEVDIFSLCFIMALDVNVTMWISLKLSVTCSCLLTFSDLSLRHPPGYINLYMNSNEILINYLIIHILIRRFLRIPPFRILEHGY
jgi:hypothetical protein